MEMIDPHLHCETLDQNDLELMAISGVRIVVSAVALPDAHENISSQAIFDYCERILNYHTWRMSKFFIDAYVCLGVSMAGVPTDYKNALEKLPNYLNREKVIGIGEIGLEPSSLTCPDLATQEEILRVQLNIAKEFGKPVQIHTPIKEKPKWVNQYLDMIKELKLDPSKVVIEHADSTVVKMINDAGCYAALTVQPWRKLTAADAAKIIETADLNRVLVDSDSNLVLASDPLSVPKTALEMRKLGIKESEIRKVIWDNPRRVFGFD